MSTGEKTLSNASQEKHLAVSLRRSLYPVGGFYWRVLVTYGGLQTYILAFKETKKTECDAMPFELQPAGDLRIDCKDILFHSSEQPDRVFLLNGNSPLFFNKQ